jgi:hypothetical protein
MKVRLFAIAVGVFGFSGVFAQTGVPATSTVSGKHHTGLSHELEVLSQLHLSSIQSEKVKASMKSAIASLKELRKNEKASSDTLEIKKQKHKAIMETYHKSLESILSTAQLTQYKALKKELRKKIESEKLASGSAPKFP